MASATSCDAGIVPLQGVEAYPAALVRDQMQWIRSQTRKQSGDLPSHAKTSGKHFLESNNLASRTKGPLRT